MNFLISVYSDIPIYEQIKDQIRKAIIHGNLHENDLLPSIRTLSRELQVGIVTVKRAYDDLVAEGYIINQSARGYYVLPLNLKIVQSQYKNKISELIKKISLLQDESNLGDDELQSLWDTRKEERK